MIPELPEPPSPPFRLGESVALGLLDVDALLVTTREIVLLPLIVTIVVVTTGTDSASVVGAAVVVVRAVWLSTTVDAASVVFVGVLLVGVGVGDVEVSSVEGSSVVVVGLDDTTGEADVGGREVVVTREDCDDDGGVVDESDSDSTSVVEGTAEVERPVPTGVF